MLLNDSQLFFSYSGNFLNLTGSESSLLRSQEPITCAYSERDESTSSTLIHLKFSSNIILQFIVTSKYIVAMVSFEKVYP